MDYVQCFSPSIIITLPNIHELLQITYENQPSGKFAKFQPL
jgi:hypothetical protein